MADVYALEIDRNINENEFAKLLDYVSPEKKGRIQRFMRFEDAQRSLLGDILARYALCKKIGIKNKSLIFTKNEYGKPFLKHYDTHFNISHSANWVLCAVDTKPVGVDVEKVSSIDFNIAKRFFSPQEYMLLMNQAEDKRQEFFFKIWTLKESFIKAEGKGLSIPLDSFNFEMNGNDINVSDNSGRRDYQFVQAFLDNGTVFAACISGISTCKIIEFNIDDIIRIASELV